MRDRVDEAWQMLKYETDRCHVHRIQSVMQNGIEAQRQSGGYRYRVTTKSLELSLVTIAMQPEASIQQIKSIDTNARAALGSEGARCSRAGEKR